MKLTVFVMLIGFVFVFAGFSSGPAEEDAMEADTMGETMDETMDETMTAGGWAHYTTIDDAMMTAEKGPAVLLFNASWCPTCREATAEIAERADELGDITVFFVDYDDERELKRTYGVTAQHTYVQIDTDGEAITLWNGGGVDQVLANVKGTMGS